MSRLCCYWWWCCCYCGNPNSGTGGGSTGFGITSGISALLSLVVVTGAISTGEWLLTEEKLPRSPSANSSVEPDSRLTYSGLWKFCVAISSRMEYECSGIEYFPNEEYSPDLTDSTMAIPYAVTKSAMFFFAATLLLVIAEVCYFATHVTRPKPRLCVFVAGVVFIVSGLLMLVGMVMYISVFKAEVGSKLRARSSFQGPPFSYKYGFSFLLYVSGFVTTEVAGTSAIFLYISWHQRELVNDNLRRKNYAGVYHLDNHIQHGNYHNHGHGGFLCERHQKRYFFGRDSVDQVDFDEFLPPPPSVDYHEYSRHLPRDLTTQTVSTTADVLQEEYSPSVHHEFVTFSLEEPLPPMPVRSEWPLDTLRRTTPV